MKIPVMIVDDERVDRYTARRRLDQHGGFAAPMEAESGDIFLDSYCSDPDRWAQDMAPVLILMDINMPGRDGFATVAELGQRQKSGLGPPSLVVTMFTSSSNPRDRQRAEALPLVKGYAEKPLNAAGAQALFELYDRFAGELGITL